MECPCIECETRYEACHSVCEPYLLWKEEQKMIQKKMSKYTEADSVLFLQRDKQLKRKGLKLKQR